MPTADSYERIAAAKTKATQAAAAAKPTLNFSAWDSASPAAQEKYTPVVPKPVVKPTLNFSAWDAASSSAQLKYAPVLPAAPVPDGGSSGSGDSHVTGSSGNGSNNSSASSVPTTSVKVATPDIILVNQETLPVELMTSLIFEDIGGQELISLSRHDLITGSGLKYQPITNLNDIAIQYNPQNIIPMPDSSSNYLSNFPIDLNSHIIEEFSSTDISHIKINSSKELEILVTGMKLGEQIEVEILTSVSAYNDTKGF